MRRHLSSLTTLLMLFLIACSGSGPGIDHSGLSQFAELGPLPDLPRVASATETVNGADHIVAGPGATDIPPAVGLDATGLRCAFTMYAFAKPEEMILNSVALDVDSVSGNYWVGLSDYEATDAWEFHGPFTDDAVVPLSGSPLQYVSESGNFHWVVVATAESSLTLVSSTIDYTVGGMLQFYVPPSGMQTVAPAPAVDPSLVIMSNAPSVAEEGAPVIFYTAGDGAAANTHMTWYNGAEWESRVLDATKRYTFTRAVWTGTEGLIVAYYNGEGAPEDPGQLFRLRTDAEWNILETEGFSSSATSPSMLSMDHRVHDNLTTVIAAYNRDDSYHVDLTSMDDIGGSSTGYVGSDGWSVAGVDVAFDPDPLGDGGWAMYSTGKIDTSEILELDFHISYFRLDDRLWTYEIGNHIDHNAPLALDLQYAPDGAVRLLMISARDLTIPFTEITASLYYDAVLGTFNGTGWDFEDLLTSSIAIHIFQSNMDVDLGVDVSWAAPDALHFANVDGTVDFTTSPEFAITGGVLNNNSNYMTETGGEFGNSGYFTGAPGITHSWATGPGGPACAYINVEQVDIDELLSGGVGNIEADLVYWSP